MVPPGELPPVVSGAEAAVSVLLGEQGVAAVPGGGGQAIYTFFRLGDCWGCGGELRVGSRVRVNARLVGQGSRAARVPYICSSVWPEGTSLPSALAPRVLAAPTAEEVAVYSSTVAGLQSLLPDTTLRPPPPLLTFEDLSSRVEHQLEAGIEELQEHEAAKKKKKEKKEKKKRRRSGESPGKHLDFLHQINDVIAELEHSVPEVMAKVAAEETVRRWGTSYPTPGEYSAASGPVAMEPRAAAIGSSSWLGLAVAPGSQPTPIQPLPASRNLPKVVDVPGSRWEEEQEEEESPVKKSLFSDIFEEPEEREERRVARVVQEAPRSLGLGLAQMMKNRLNRSSVEEVKEVRVVPGEKGGGRAHSRSRSRSRSRAGKKKASNRERSNSLESRKKSRKMDRSRSRSKVKKKKKYKSRSPSSSPEKKKKSKSKKHKKKESRSRSRSSSRGEKKKKRSRSTSEPLKQKKRKRSRSRSREWKKSRSRSKTLERERKKRRLRSRSRSKSRRREEERPVVVLRRSSSRSMSRGPNTARSQGSRSREQSRGAPSGRSREQSTRLRSIEEQRSTEEEEEDEETIVAKRRLERLKLLSKIKEKKAEEESKAEEQAKEDERKVEAAGALRRSLGEAPVWPPPPPPLESEIIPVSVFEQGEAEEKLQVREEVEQLVVPVVPPDLSKTPVVVTVDVEVVVVAGRTSITQLGAMAWLSEPSFQPVSFFRYILSDLVRDRELLIPATKAALMDTLRLKTSNFDVAKSGQKAVVFKHPDKGKVSAVEERAALGDLLTYLGSLGGPVVLVAHSKDAVLPPLLAAMTARGLAAAFTSVVTHVCDLVSLAWGLRLDRLWVGKRHPGLRAVSAALCPDIPWEDGCLPADRTAAAMWTLLERVRARDPGLVLLAQAGGQTPVDYIATKYSLVQAVQGEEVARPPAVEVGLGSDQWGRRARVELVWEREGVVAARDRILERLREAQDRRTPVPVPDDSEEQEEAVRILRSKEGRKKRREEREEEKEKRKEEKELRREEKAKEKEDVEKLAKELKEVRDEQEVKTYNAFLPAGVLAVLPAAPVVATLKVPGLKPRMAEVLGRRVVVEQREEFSLATLTPTTGLLVQPADSMFPGVEVTITAATALTIDSKTVNFAVAAIKI